MTGFSAVAMAAPVEWKVTTPATAAAPGEAILTPSGDNVATPAVKPPFGPGGPCVVKMKVYRIHPDFCPQDLVNRIPGELSRRGYDGGWPIGVGIPPIYASGQNVLVRQTRDVHQEITDMLEELGALVKPVKYGTYDPNSLR